VKPEKVKVEKAWQKTAPVETPKAEKGAKAEKGPKAEKAPKADKGAKKSETAPAQQKTKD
jgi:hypothetical protein